MCARGCIRRKHASECMLVPSGRDVCAHCRLRFGMAAWAAGKPWTKLAHAHIVTLHVA